MVTLHEGSDAFFECQLHLSVLFCQPEFFLFWWWFIIQIPHSLAVRWPGSKKVFNLLIRRPVSDFRKERSCTDFFTLHQIIEERCIGLVGMGKTFNQ